MLSRKTYLSRHTRRLDVLRSGALPGLLSLGLAACASGPDDTPAPDGGSTVDGDAAPVSADMSPDATSVPDTGPTPDGGGDASHVGYYVSGRHLYDRCGERVVLRGVNKMAVWTDISGNAFPEIAQTGANVVRIVWVTDGAYSVEQFEATITRAIENELIPMVELHDATGDLSKLSSLVDWWVRSDVVAVIQRHERDLLVNIGNEVGDGNVSESAFYDAYASAITRMREAGYRTPLVIDGTQWGQNIDILQAQGPALLAHDPDANLLFSVHMWWPPAYHSTSTGYATVADRVVGEIAQSVSMDLPLIVGEFAPIGVGCLDGIPYATIMSECEDHDIGWMAWSWGPGNSDCEAMDMTTDNTYAGLHDWGLEVAVTHAEGIANTSIRPYSMVNGRCE